MSAAAAKAKTDTHVSMAERFPGMGLIEKLQATLICGVLLAVAVVLGWRVIGPTDPLAAVTIVGHANPIVAMAALVCFVAIGSSVATLAMRGRLTDFGVFAVGVALTGLARHGGDLTSLLQYEAQSADGRAGVFGWLALDVLLWTVVPVVSLAACAVTEAWSGITGPADLKPDDKPAKAQNNIMSRWLTRMATRTGTSVDWKTELRHGGITFVVTAVVAMMVIRLASGHTDAPVNPGQVCFAIFLGFWLGALVSSQFARPALGVWPCLAVPVVAAAGHLLAMARPDLSGPLVRYSEIAIIAPNALARGLPVDYLALGPAAAVLGTWTAQRFLRAREEAAET